MSKIEDDNALYAKLDAKHLAMKDAKSAFPRNKAVLAGWIIYNGYADYFQEFMAVYDMTFAQHRGNLPVIKW